MCQVCGDEAHGEALPTDGEAETQSNVCLAGAAWTKGDDILAPVYPFAAGQFREHPVKHLSGYQGWVHADGYAGFNGVFGEGKATEVACMAHIRRKFVDVFAAQGSAIAEEAIKRIAQLYGVEKQARGQSPEARAALRQENAKPIFDDLEEWLRDQLPKISGKSPLAKAIRYALGRMPKTRPYLDNGFLELDTDVVEQPLSQIFWVFGGFSRHASTIFA